MSALDISGLIVLGAGALICVTELLLGDLWALPPVDPCRERPSSLPLERV